MFSGDLGAPRKFELPANHTVDTVSSAKRAAAFKFHTKAGLGQYTLKAKLFSCDFWSNMLDQFGSQSILKRSSEYVTSKSL